MSRATLKGEVIGALACLSLRTRRWHDARIDLRAGTSLERSIVLLHACNFALWHHEDDVRRLDLPDAELVRHKRAIDRFNAKRNGVVEDLDAEIHALLPTTYEEVHSETPGMIIDRLSILNLRIFHLDAAAANGAADAAARSRLAAAQLDDLTGILATYLDHLVTGRKGFRLYRQHKHVRMPRCSLPQPGTGVLEAVDRTGGAARNGEVAHRHQVHSGGQS